MDTETRVQILNEDSANTLKKDVNPNIFPRAMDK